ncbi:MAG: hypothetical protein E5V27_31185, partial [Mesorhizobium sp.]
QTPPDQALPDQAVPDQGFTDQNFTGIAIVVNMRMIVPSVFRFARGGSLGDHTTIVPDYGSRFRQG